MALRGKDGTLTASLSESCELLNKEFEKVFVRDDNQPIPITKEFNGVKLTTCAVTEEDVRWWTPGSWQPAMLIFLDVVHVIKRYWIMLLDVIVVLHGFIPLLCV